MESKFFDLSAHECDTCDKDTKCVLKDLVAFTREHTEITNELHKTERESLHALMCDITTESMALTLQIKLDPDCAAIYVATCTAVYLKGIKDGWNKHEEIYKLENQLK
jgi:hypothetical protein